jgi:hypothetical protein
MVYSAYSAGKGSRHSVGHGDTLGKRHLGPPTIFVGGIGIAPSLAVVGPRTRLGVQYVGGPQGPFFEKEFKGVRRVSRKGTFERRCSAIDGEPEGKRSFSPTGRQRLGRRGDRGNPLQNNEPAPPAQLRMARKRQVMGRAPNEENSQKVGTTSPSAALLR